MLLGTYEHNLDAKNRVFIPVKFREELGDKFIYKVHNSKYPSIQLYSMKDFKGAFREALAKAAETRQDPRTVRAMFYMGAGEATFDSQGRAVFGQHATIMAGIDKKCIFIGFGDYVEVMSPENYANYLRSISESGRKDEQAREDEMEVYRSYKSMGKYLNVGE